jgi:DNA uptake protein ComE-like DNA-binding protein
LVSPGGPKRFLRYTAAIVNFRRYHGLFERFEQLPEIKGIGLRTLEKLRPLLKIE